MNDYQILRHIVNLKNEYTNSNGDIHNISILDGGAAKILFFSTLCQIFPNQIKTSIEFTKAHTNRLINYIKEKPVNQEYLDGLAGLCYGIEFAVQNKIIERSEVEFLKEMDDFFYQRALDSLKHNNFDFFYGALGYSNYLILRKKASVDNLKKLGVIGDTLIANLDQTKNYVWQNDNETEKEIVNFSISHGLSSIIIFLTKLVELNIHAEKYKPIILHFSELILQSRENLRIPDYTISNAPVFTPLRWCHGELGIVSCLSYVGHTLKSNRITSLALDVAKNVASFRLDTQKATIKSATICHGSLGIAHIFAKWHKTYWQSQEFKDAAEYWYNHSQDILESEIGYKYLANEKYEPLEGILNGTEGIGLALLSALDSKIDADSWQNSILLY